MKVCCKNILRQGRVFFIDGTCQNCCDVFFPKFHNNMLIILLNIKRTRIGFNLGRKSLLTHEKLNFALLTGFKSNQQSKLIFLEINAVFARKPLKSLFL